MFGLHVDSHLIFRQVYLAPHTLLCIERILHTGLAFAAGHTLHTNDNRIRIMAGITVTGFDLLYTVSTAAATALQQLPSVADHTVYADHDQYGYYDYCPHNIYLFSFSLI